MQLFRIGFKFIAVILLSVQEVKNGGSLKWCRKYKRPEYADVTCQSLIGLGTEVECNFSADF